MTDMSISWSQGVLASASTRNLFTFQTVIKTTYPTWECFEPPYDLISKLCWRSIQEAQVQFKAHFSLLVDIDMDAVIRQKRLETVL